jgi:hypothetical protein
LGPAARYNEGMTTVKDIKAAIEKLSQGERDELERWFEERWDAWDKQIAADFDAGKFDAIISEIEDDLQHGRLREFP